MSVFPVYVLYMWAEEIILKNVRFLFTFLALKAPITTAADDKFLQHLS